MHIAGLLAPTHPAGTAHELDELEQTDIEGRRARLELLVASYVSVITIVDRKITRWRDDLDPIAVFDAIGWPGGK